MWQIKKSRHYIFHYFPNSLAEKEIKEIVKNQEATYSEILFFLGVKNNKIINYFLYPNNKIKGEMMGDDGNGNAIRNKFEVHAVYKQDVKCIGAHEDTHLLSLPLGVSVKLFREGLAEFISKTWHEKSHDFWAKKFLDEKEEINFSKILDNSKWDDSKDEVLYPCVGSFCSFLINEIGKDKFLKLYGSLDRDKNVSYNLKTIEEITGKSLVEWQKNWEESILSIANQN